MKKHAVMIRYKNGEYGVKINASETPTNLKCIRSLPNRKRDARGRFWTCSLSLESVERLRDRGFSLHPALVAYLQKNKEEKSDYSLGFSLCPLYLWVLDNQKNRNYADRSLQKIERTTNGNQKEFHQRAGERSSGQSDGEAQGKRKESNVEKKSIRRHDRSNASSRSPGKAFERITKGQGEAWDKFQRRERTINDSDSPISKSTIISMWLREGISNPNQTCKTYLQECSRCIQSRLRKSGGDDSNRIGWNLSCSVKTTEIGSEENRSIREPWLGCATLKSLQTVKYIPGLRETLFTFQLEDVLRVDKLNGRALIASEMGLGKTAQALAWCQLHPELRPVIIVVPASLKLNWEREAKMWMTDPEIVILYGGTPAKI